MALNDSRVMIFPSPCVCPSCQTRLNMVYYGKNNEIIDADTVIICAWIGKGFDLWWDYPRSLHEYAYPFCPTCHVQIDYLIVTDDRRLITPNPQTWIRMLLEQ